MANKKRDIRYINRDFNDFRSSLVEFSKTYFPNTYNDFTDTSTGMLFMEMASYVGDVLSFYLDNQIQETYLQRARQTENLFDMAYMLGYNPKVTTTATVNIDFYQQLPAKVVGGVTVPDYDYTLRIPTNTSISSNADSSVKFLIEDEVDFSHSSSLDPTEVSVYTISGNQPTRYLLKKTRKAISATINSTEFTFTSPKKFDTKNLVDTNIIGILDVVDSEGNTWYEVPNLAQEVIFDSVKNTNTNDPNYSDDSEVSNLLRTKQVQTRFASRFINKTTLQLQFGAGSTSDNDEEIVPNPDNVGLGLPFAKSKLTTAFSPTNFVFTDTYGIAPSNTTLTVRYLTGGGVGSNTEAGTLTGLTTTDVKFNNSSISDTTLASQIFSSLASNNELAADGGQDGDTNEEIRQNALGNFQNQLRTVTKEDYIVRALSMPADLGVVAKAYATPTILSQDKTGDLDLYILSYNADKKLRNASSALKRNLQTYLSEYRMINDSINIKDAFIINIGVDFDIVTRPNYNSNEVILNCINSLQEYFSIDKININEPIILKDLFILLDKVEGVQTVKEVKITNKSGESKGYSKYGYDVEGATLNGVIYPSVDPMIFEVKNPDTDITGRVVAL